MSCKSFAVIASLLFSATLQAQMEMPKPAPELKKLDYFTGSWSTDATMKPGPMGPGGKVSGTDHIEWMPGNFFVLIHNKFNSPMGSGTELAIMGYDSTKNVYTYAAYNSAGEHEAATGTLDGDTWTWNSQESSMPNGTKWRYIEKVLSPSSYTIKFEMSSPDGTWVTVMEGKATKQ